MESFPLMTLFDRYKRRIKLKPNQVTKALALTAICFSSLAATKAWELNIQDHIPTAQSLGAQSILSQNKVLAGETIDNKVFVALLDNSTNVIGTLTTDIPVTQNVRLSSVTEKRFFIKQSTDLYMFSINNSSLSYTNVAQLPLSNYSFSIVPDGDQQGVYVVSFGSPTIEKFDLPNATNQEHIVGDVASGMNGMNYILKWESESGTSYQIQSSPDLSTWHDVGTPIVGDGTTMQWANAISTNQFFYRIKSQ